MADPVLDYETHYYNNTREARWRFLLSQGGETKPGLANACAVHYRSSGDRTACFQISDKKLYIRGKQWVLEL